MLNTKDYDTDIKELARICGIVSRVNFPQYNFDVEPIGDEYYIQVYYNEADILTGVTEEQRGRKWVFPTRQTDGQIVQTCFKAVLTSLEHRCREHFTYDGKLVMQPHLPLEKLTKICPELNSQSAEGGVI